MANKWKTVDAKCINEYEAAVPYICFVINWTNPPVRREGKLRRRLQAITVSWIRPFGRESLPAADAGSTFYKLFEVNKMIMRQ